MKQMGGGTPTLSDSEVSGNERGVVDPTALAFAELTSKPWA